MQARSRSPRIREERRSNRLNAAVVRRPGRSRSGPKTKEDPTMKRIVPRVRRGGGMKLLGRLAVVVMTLGLAARASAAICTTCGDPPPLPPPPPPPSTSPPDAVLQFSPCLPAATAPSLVSGVRASIITALHQLDLKHDGPVANPDVRTQCITSAGRQTLAVWFSPVGSYGSSDTSAKRDAAIAPINILAAGEQFAVRFSATGLNHMMAFAWADVDKTLNLSGEPDPTGSIHLSGYDLDFFASTVGFPNVKQLRLTVNGILYSPFADINFWGWATDSLVVNSSTGRIVCSTSTGFDMDDSIEEALADLFADPEAMVANLLDPGPGCRIAQALPTEVMLPNPSGISGIAFKEVFTYQRLVVNSSGLTAGGVHSTVMRSPSAAVSGPSEIRTEVDMPAIAQYRAVTTDMRPPLTVSWSSPNAAPRTGTGTTMVWNLPDGYANQYFNR